MDEKVKLSSLREEIDKIDCELVSLLNRRADVVLQVKATKKRDNIEIYSPEREIEIIERVLSLAANGAFPKESVDTIFREIISATRSLIGSLSVACLGPSQSLSLRAARRQFGECVTYNSYPSLDMVFTQVAAGRAHYGVVPVETDAAGLLMSSIEIFMASDLEVVAEIFLRQELVLLSAISAFDDISRVYADSASLAQTGQWLSVNLPDVEQRVVDDSAVAVQRALDEQGAAVLGPEDLAEDNELHTVAKSLGSDAAMVTRLFVVGKKSPKPSGRDRTTLLASISDQSGALHLMLSPFADSGVMITKIESKPMRGRKGECLFYLDIDGHAVDPSVANALDQLRPLCSYFRILGSYPANNPV